MPRFLAILLPVVLATGCAAPFDGLQIADVAAGDNSQLRYGEVGRNCSVAAVDLGTEVGRASGYIVHDTQPGSTRLRTHYLTGFRDGCARQFSAALVLFGDIGTHEIVRYADTGVAMDYARTDEAYESVKGAFCGVGRGVPCGRRIDALSRITTFVSIYETFGASDNWIDMLLYRGDIIAKDAKSV